MDGRRIIVTPVSTPIIYRLMTVEGKISGFVTGDNMQIMGRSLTGKVTRVRVGDSEITPRKIEEGQLFFSLEEDTLRAGEQDVVVVHKGMEGNMPPDQVTRISNKLSLKLRPKVTDEITVDSDGKQKGSAISAELSVGIEPKVGKEQKVAVFLNEASLLASSDSFIFPALPREGVSNRVKFVLDGVAPGDYLLRVSIDGAESLLSTSDGKYNSPKVTL